MSKNCCLFEGFFSQLDTLYENCYRINPNPSKAFLDRIRLIEVEARALKDNLEALQADSYRYVEPENLTDNEKVFLENYDRTNLILQEFMPYITAAYVLTAKEPDRNEEEIIVPTLTPLNLIEEQKNNPDIANLVGIYQPMPISAVNDYNLNSMYDVNVAEEHQDAESFDRFNEVNEVVINEVNNEFNEVNEEVDENMGVIDESNNVFLSWENVQTCYPASSIISYLKQVYATAYITFDNDEYFSPVLNIESMKKTHSYKYRLTEHAFQYDIDSILVDDMVVEDLQKLVDDLESL